jgi:four helix bundle protein
MDTLQVTSTSTTMPDYKKLDVFKLAHSLTLRIYKATEAFPGHERFGITNQLRRAAVSIGANLAEGSGRGTDREMARFVSIALGSANELDYLLLVAKDLAFLREPDLRPDAQSVARMLTKLRASLDHSR